jgi:DNA-binding transcriptional MerR regulator
VRESIVKKAYYSIGEVCDLTGLKPHVLRYWESQFDILRPTKNRAGNRVFRPKDIELVMLVKNLLYEQKYTIEGANQKLLDMRREGELEGGQHEVLGPEFLASMKTELEQLARILNPADPLDGLLETPSARESAEEVDAEEGEEVDAKVGEEDGPGEEVRTGAPPPEEQLGLGSMEGQSPE